MKQRGSSYKVIKVTNFMKFALGTGRGNTCRETETSFGYCVEFNGSALFLFFKLTAMESENQH